MSNPIRWMVSSIAMAAAVVLTLVATLGGFAYYLATNPAPAREILGPLPSDPVVSQLLPKDVGTQITDRIPAALPLPNALTRIRV
ncbi:hypothetical protein [Paeniglutamicibacter cryotolerans]|uniref:Uncharacterized protein n=1 Tax=Paeniglutamicibacter cryotolerans TaxID=670079 RepID=A0A839QKY5_9MICC|nr:hypothetical protein [Paeniglutamicibacter cryotolerans]MBB2993832.1 hypothetical protein [Paeniglutamicibacter cryotolerans]